ncbi:hypothetical protein HHL16_09630 [Pseudoflavitalea sp. G-6-1-2]|uniref:hypothetical protein n=1 Tax=Pseudoflavitalea sp. G-6-1-2 TaxID=2728841 RepID=UPI00146D250E|nr:hypothetical protein [Pseudoflavitalea sp. G-6-1-2]NML21134.1 hypothetical protein [Pseudoflavitalea sp. G-6-1-2]
MRTLTYLGLLLIPVTILIAQGCGKDKLRTKPSIKVKSVTPRDVSDKETIPVVVIFDYADKEGDIGGTLWMGKTRLNLQQTSIIEGRDSTRFAVPVPEVRRTDGQIEIRLVAVNLAMVETPSQPDTMALRFALRDEAGNTSDTVSAGTIILRH